ncbi:hypothetical protein K438DRAFT_2001432 [Mycena galopus ATCC 62051]|nr:hypothetical protein K438DRAFT_2001432 [Mycena galopus ATCC 62051]
MTAPVLAAPMNLIPTSSPASSVPTFSDSLPPLCVPSPALSDSSMVSLGDELSDDNAKDVPLPDLFAPGLEVEMASAQPTPTFTDSLGRMATPYVLLRQVRYGLNEEESSLRRSNFVECPLDYINMDERIFPHFREERVVVLRLYRRFEGTRLHYSIETSFLKKQEAPRLRRLGWMGNGTNLCQQALETRLPPRLPPSLLLQASLPNTSARPPVDRGQTPSPLQSRPAAKHGRSPSPPRNIVRPEVHRTQLNEPATVPRADPTSSTSSTRSLLEYSPLPLLHRLTDALKSWSSDPVPTTSTRTLPLAEHLATLVEEAPLLLNCIAMEGEQELLHRMKIGLKERMSEDRPPLAKKRKHNRAGKRKAWIARMESIHEPAPKVFEKLEDWESVMPFVWTAEDIDWFINMEEGDPNPDPDAS